MKTHQTQFNELSLMLNGGEQSAFEKSLLTLLQSPLFHERGKMPTDVATQQAYSRFKAVNRLMALSPSDIKGLSKRLLSAHELVTLADGTLTTVMTIHFNLCLGTLLEHGDQVLHKDLIQELLELKTVGVFLATELGYGNNIVSLKTEATFDRGTNEFVINTHIPEAQKFMPNTAAEGIPKLAIVMARLKEDGEDHGVFPFVVRIKDGSGKPLPGIKVTALGEKPGYALDNAVTSFENVRIPRHHALLGKLADKTQSRRRRFLQSMDRVQTGKLCLSACAIKGAQASLQIALRYSAQRKTFAPQRSDVAILEYRNQQKALFSALADTVAMTLMYRKAHTLLQQRETLDDTSVNRYLALTKVLSTYAGQSTALTCREKIGAQGLFSVNKIIGFSNQVHGAITAEGDNQILLIKTAREMLMAEGYAAPKKSRRWFRKFRVDNVRDQQLLLRERERRLLKQLKFKMAKAKLLNQELFPAWNDSVNLAIELAQACGQRVAHENLCEQLERVQDPEEREALEQLTLLFGLNQIVASGGWYVAHRLISSRHWKVVAGHVDQLLKAILPDQDKWIRSFMIPDGVLRSPLLADDYVAAYNFMHSPTSQNQAVAR